MKIAHESMNNSTNFKILYFYSSIQTNISFLTKNSKKQLMIQAYLPSPSFHSQIHLQSPQSPAPPQNNPFIIITCPQACYLHTHTPFKSCRSLSPSVFNCLVHVRFAPNSLILMTDWVDNCSGSFILLCAGFRGSMLPSLLLCLPDELVNTGGNDFSFWDFRSSGIFELWSISSMLRVWCNECMRTVL